MSIGSNSAAELLSRGAITVVELPHLEKMLYSVKLLCHLRKEEKGRMAKAQNKFK